MNRHTAFKKLFYPKMLIVILIFHMSFGSIMEQAIAQEMGNFLTYENSTYGIKMNYPADWIKKESISRENIVAFRSPSSDAGLAIFVHNLSSLLGYENRNISLDTFSKLQLEYLQNLSNINIINFDNSTLGSHSAHKVEYHFDYDSVPMNSTQVWTVKDGNAYVIQSIGDITQVFLDEGSMSDAPTDYDLAVEAVLGGGPMVDTQIFLDEGSMSDLTERMIRSFNFTN